MEMDIKEFITNNYNYISAIATNEYNKEKNNVLYMCVNRSVIKSK